MHRVLPVSLRPALAEHAERLRALFGKRLIEVRLFGSFAHVAGIRRIEALMERGRQFVLDSNGQAAIRLIN